MSKRGDDWIDFSNKVLAHINSYTTSQYGDKGEDCITNYSIQECLGHIDKYTKRYGRQSREGQQELDFVKMAHYVQCASEKHDRKVELEGDDNVYTETFEGDKLYLTVEQLKGYLYEEMSGVKIKKIKIVVEVTE